MLTLFCLLGDDSRDGTRVSASCGAEICVANSSVVEGLNLDHVFHPFYLRFPYLHFQLPPLENATQDSTNSQKNT